MNASLLFRQIELLKTSPARISSLAAKCLLRVIHTLLLPNSWTGHLDLIGSVPHPYDGDNDTSPPKRSALRTNAGGVFRGSRHSCIYEFLRQELQELCALSRSNKQEQLLGGQDAQ